jgi:hypothetical protein
MSRPNTSARSATGLITAGWTRSGIPASWGYPRGGSGDTMILRYDPRKGRDDNPRLSLEALRDHVEQYPRGARYCGCSMPWTSACYSRERGIDADECCAVTPADPGLQ